MMRHSLSQYLLDLATTRRSGCTPWLQTRARYPQHLTHPPLGRPRNHFPHSSDVRCAKGWRFIASFKMSLSSTSSPTFCLSCLICSSLSASSSRGRERSAFSAANKNRSCHSSIPPTVRPCLRAASAAEVSPRTMLNTNAARRFAVQRWTAVYSAICHLHQGTLPCLIGGFTFEGNRIGTQQRRKL